MSFKKTKFDRLEEEIRILFTESEEGLFFFNVKFPEFFNPLNNLQIAAETVLRKIRHGNYEEDAWFFALADGLFLAMHRDMTPEQVIEEFQKFQQRRDDKMKTERKKRKDQIEHELRENQRNGILETQKQKAAENRPFQPEKPNETVQTKTLSSSSPSVPEKQNGWFPDAQKKIAEDNVQNNLKDGRQNTRQKNQTGSVSSSIPSQSQKTKSLSSGKSASIGKADGGRSK